MTRTLKPLLPRMLPASVFAVSAGLLIGASLVAMHAPAAHARNELAYAQNPLTVHTQGAVTYVNGGVGKNESDAMRAMADRYPLRMMFSERKNDEFIVDVAVEISDRDGHKVFELSDAGPMLYVNLPAGHYRISARFRERTESREVTLGGNSSKDLYFHWQGAPRA